ncbi:MAG: hypothetical protein ACXVQ3_08125 [Gaiellaceae bacterium]
MHEPSSDVSPPLPESRGERYLRHGRRARMYASAALIVAVVAVLIVLISRNTGTAKLDWVFGSTNASLVWIILAAAVLGWLLGVATAPMFRHRTRRRETVRADRS